MFFSLEEGQGQGGVGKVFQAAGLSFGMPIVWQVSK